MFDVVCKSIDDRTEEFRRISRELWENPELSLEENNAHDILTDFLEDHGFVVTRHYKLVTAFRATFEYGSKEVGPTIAIMCEYDALPGIGHGCGHNLIAECGLATALGVKAAIEKGSTLIGKLVVLGTPDEEGNGGKIDLIKAGAFDDIDVTLMAHPAPYTVSRPVFLSLIQVSIEYHGKEAHASTDPWNGVNALDAAVLCYQNLSCFRQQMKPELRLSGIFENAGIRPSIIPGYTKLRYEFRAPNEPDLEIVKKKVTDCANAAALASACSVDISFSDRYFQALINNDPLTETFDKHATSLGIPIITDHAAIQELPKASTDAGNVSRVVPTLHPLFDIGTKAPFHSVGFCDDAGSTEAHSRTLGVAKALALTAVDLMLSPKLTEDVKRDFQLSFQKENTVRK